MNYNLLLVDDDKEVLEVNAGYFTQLGYRTASASDAQKALQLLDSFMPDCIILDVMMPGLDGFTALPLIREKTKAPVIFLTGKGTEDDKISGLLLGADDYVVKPYSFRELEARIQVVIRRYQTIEQKKDNVLEFPPLRIDLINHKVYCKTEEINLSNREYQLLQMLAASPGETFTFEQICKAIWGTYLDSDRKTVMVTASRLRRKLGEYPGLADCVETVWSKGYKFVR